VWRSQVAKHVVKKAPSILVVPLLCCLVVLLSNVISVFAAASDTHKALVIAREQNVQLAAAINLVYAQEEVSMLNQRKMVESTTLELRAQLVAGGEEVRGGAAAAIGQKGGAVGWVQGAECGAAGVQMLTSLRMVELAVQLHPEYPWMEERYIDTLGPIVLRILNLPVYFSSIGWGRRITFKLAPLGRTAKVFSLSGGASEADIGHDSFNPCQVRCQTLCVRRVGIVRTTGQELTDTLVPPQVHWDQTDEGQPICDAECMHMDDVDASTRCFPNRRAEAMSALQARSLSSSPLGSLLTQNAFIMYPIFVDTTNAAYNATFGRGHEVHDCPAGACYDAETGKRFWGMVEVHFPVAFARCGCQRCNSCES
jgi:hypothetical protein